MSNQIDANDFNEQIADAMMPDSDDELRNWASTQFGRRFTGIEAQDTELPDICPLCELKSDTIAKRRRNSAYVDDAKNWLISCADCFQMDYDGLQHDWEEYYSMVY